MRCLDKIQITIIKEVMQQYGIQTKILSLSFSWIIALRAPMKMVSVEWFCLCAVSCERTFIIWWRTFLIVSFIIIVSNLETITFFRIVSCTTLVRVCTSLLALQLCKLSSTIKTRA